MRVSPCVTFVILWAVLGAPLAMADHPGSNHGLSGLAGREELVHRLPDVQASFAAWETAHPARVERFVMGSTNTGFPLEGIRITDEAVPFDAAATPTGQKFRVYLDGGHHGNEFLGVELIMYYLAEFLDLASTDNATQDFLRVTELYAVPIVNVDGNFLDTRKNVNQVDPNRNYDFQWGGPGSSDLLVDLTYRGPAPASEREVAANMNFGTQIRPDLWVTMHTGVAEFYWPWGYTDQPSPDDVFFRSLEGPFENATRGRVDAMQAAELYQAAGATDDWGYGVLGVPTFTFEVHEDQFIPVYGEGIPAEIEEQLAGLDFMVRNVRHMGAHLSWTAGPTQIVITNDGWGLARNASLQGQPLPDIAPGASISVERGVDPMVLEYPPLLIETSKTRSVLISAASEPTPEKVAPAALVIVGLGLLWTARQRRPA